MDEGLTVLSVDSRAVEFRHSRLGGPRVCSGRVGESGSQRQRDLRPRRRDVVPPIACNCHRAFLGWRQGPLSMAERGPRMSESGHVTALDTEVASPKPPPAYVGERLAQWRHKTDSALFLFAAASIPILLLEVQRTELNPGDALFIDIANIVIFAVFLVDYIIELVKSEDRWAYVRSEWLLGLVVLTSGVALLPAAGALGALRLMRLLRPISGVVRVLTVGGVVVQDGKRLLRRKIVRSAFMMGALVWATSAAALMLAEGTGPDGVVSNYPEALWWSFTAMLAGESYTIGPVTLAGRLITAFTMVVGLAIFAVVIARVAAFLVDDPDNAASP